VAHGAFIHTPSRFVADEVVAEFGASPERVRVVAHGIPAHRGRAPAGAGPRSATALPERTRRYVLALGTVEPRKDLPGLVRAFDRLAGDHPDVALVLAGSRGWGDDALERAIAASPWRHRIVRTGYIDDDALGDVLGGACVLAYPSVYEGFGFPPLEAMAAGVPVVATAVGAIPEVVGDGALLVAPGDIDALAGAVAGVLDDDARRRGLIERGRARAGLFSWTACGEGLAALYAAAARSHGR
jgi:glycosyltransferase involved in cell wall biosynthesis